MKSDHLIGLAVTAIAFLVMLMFLVVAAFAHDWEHHDPEIDRWYDQLKMPDNPAISCCGEADAYWADSFETVIDKATGQAKTYAIVTDERPDCCYGRTPMGVGITRRHIDVGTRILVPDRKLVDATKQQNPMGHGIIFLGPGSANDNVYCFLPPGGV